MAEPTGEIYKTISRSGPVRSTFLGRANGRFDGADLSQEPNRRPGQKPDILLQDPQVFHAARFAAEKARENGGVFLKPNLSDRLKRLN